MSRVETVVGEIAELTEEARMLRDVNEREAVERQAITKSILSLLSDVKQIELSSEAMKAFDGFESGRLAEGGELRLSGEGGGTVSRNLESLSSEEFVSVAAACIHLLMDPVEKHATAEVEAIEQIEQIEQTVPTPETIRTEETLAPVTQEQPETHETATQEVDARETRDTPVASWAPELAVKVSVGGDRLLIFDWRSYHLILKNEGADSLRTRVTASVLSRTHRYRMVSLEYGGEKSLDLRKFHNLPRDSKVNVEVTCKDAAGREYGGVLSLGLEDGGWQRIPLQPS